MILDAILLLLVTIAIQLIKNKFTNFLFFPKNAVLFLPPDDQQTNNQEPKEIKSKKKKQKTQVEVSVRKIQYNDVKDYPFCNEMSRVVMTTAGMVAFVAIRLVIGLFYQKQSLLSFYTLTVILIYTVKLSIDTFFLTNYNRRNCFLLSLGLNIFFYIIAVTFGDMQGVFDQHGKEVVQDYIKHLQIIFNRELTFITHRGLLALALFFNFFIVVGLMPAIIKFGNWYSKTLKEMYYQNEEGQERVAIARRVDREQSDVKEQQGRLKEQSRQTVFKLNFYLGFMLVVIFFSHRFALNFGSQLFIDVIRTTAMAVCTYIICETMSTAIEFNGSFAYRFVLQYFQEQDADKRKELRKKIVTYIYYIWYHYFQFAARILVPVLIFLLVISWKYLFYQMDIVTGPVQSRAFNADIECKVSTDQLAILQNLYKCPVNISQPIINQQRYFLSGLIETIPLNLPQQAIQQNMQHYSILTRAIMSQFFQQLFWYSSVSIYLTTVVYILFLRKTVYEL